MLSTVYSLSPSEIKSKIFHTFQVQGKIDRIYWRGRAVNML